MENLFRESYFENPSQILSNILPCFKFDCSFQKLKINFSSKTFESIESFSTLYGCIESEDSKTWQDVRDMMISICEIGLFMRGLSKQMERHQAPFFDITPSAFLGQ